MITTIKKWGNSFGVRLTKRMLEEYGLKEGNEIKIKIEKVKPKEKVDLSGIPTFSETDTRVSEHHDKYLYGSG
jgi:hypothetical protein